MNELKQTITIYDPVGGMSYVLDPETRSARKAEFFRKAEPAPSVPPSVATNRTAPPKGNALSGLSLGSPIKKIQPYYPATAKAAGASGLVQLDTLISETGEVIAAEAATGHPLLREAALQAARGWEFKPTELAGKPVKVRCLMNFNFKLVNEEPAPAQGADRNPKYTVHTQQLRKQMIEGIECEGERKVTTLLTGAIGNDRPIETASETWYSPELKMMILSKRSDPRFGESTYRVTNIIRTEPEATLFQVPPDYTIKESGK
jgi:TonB family protein